MTKDRVALISCWDKSGIIPLAESLIDQGWTIISTGGTASTLSESGVSVTDVSDYTGHPSFLDGRVKTLHPAIFGGILARRHCPEDMEALGEFGYLPIDLVVVNLYPFEATLASSPSEAEILEKIDVGGATLLRAAAKNFPSVMVCCDPSDYPGLLKALNLGDVDAVFRRRLAGSAFRHLSRYDALIADYLDPTTQYPDELTLPLKKKWSLRYGENPHQSAAFYSYPGNTSVDLSAMELLMGPELSFNNIVDIDAAVGLLSEFDEPGACAVKHTNPCGVSLGDDIASAFSAAYESDPVSIFGGVVALNRPVDMDVVSFIVDKKLFLEVLIAPSFSEDALTRLARRKKLRVIAHPGLKEIRRGDHDSSARRLGRFVSGGVLLNSPDVGAVSVTDWTVAGQYTPTDAQWRDAEFAWLVAKHTKSNAIVIARDQRTLGVGAGQMNRVGSAQLALDNAGDAAEGAVLASDGFLPFDDVAQAASRAGIGVIVQPGGSLRDEDSIKVADATGMAMLFTGRRHFRH